MRFIKKTALVGVALLMLVACGQRGPLYIPADEPVENQPTNEINDNVDPSENSNKRDMLILLTQNGSINHARGVI